MGRQVRKTYTDWNILNIYQSIEYIDLISILIQTIKKIILRELDKTGSCIFDNIKKYL